jgi:hypothetical protein
MDDHRWVPCKVALANKVMRNARPYLSARLYLSDVSGVLEPKMRVLLEVMHPNGTTLQIIGVVERSIRRMKNYRYVAIRIPWDVGVALAKLVGADVKKGERVVVHNYVARVKEVRPPPLS